MLNYIKARPWLYRGLRTFFQAFISTMAAQFVLVSDVEITKRLLLTILVSALAAGLSAVMNIESKEEEYE